jgi:uncharacterized protein DUF4153
MRLPSLVTLAERVREVVVRFPWTMAAGVVAAVATIITTTQAADAQWARIAMVAALGVPLTLALTLLAEERGWSPARSAGLNLGGVALLIVFYLVWPGPDRKHEAIRYFQLSAAVHLLVAALPFIGQQETSAFWQYNRRLFLGILRAAVFSHVLFIGLAIALAALDKLFGVNVPGELYARMGVVIAFVLNTAIFLSGLPLGLRALDRDTSYPRVLKVFAQYILTPLVFIYLVLLLAYLVKIVAGGEWPSGWIGWLVTSVAVAGLLGFLLVHPLRHDADEAWIRTYTRWVFIGLIPAAAMLLVAFWKRILPYGLTEPRLLGVLLGLWLLIMAVSYTIRQDAGIRRIPVTLAVLLLLTLYGPLSVTNLAVASQGRRLARLVLTHPGEGTAQGQPDGREASAALRFLLDHGARRQIAAAIPGELPKVNWDSLPRHRDQRDSVASQFLAGTGVRYVAEYAYTPNGYVHLYARKGPALHIREYEWMLNISGRDTVFKLAGADSVRVRFDSASSIARVLVGGDSLVFDLGRLASDLAASPDRRQYDVPAGRLRLDAAVPGRRGALMLETIDGRRTGDTVRVGNWRGTLFLGR